MPSLGAKHRYWLRLLIATCFVFTLIACDRAEHGPFESITVDWLGPRSKRLASSCLVYHDGFLHIAVPSKSEAHAGIIKYDVVAKEFSISEFEDASRCIPIPKHGLIVVLEGNDSITVRSESDPQRIDKTLSFTLNGGADMALYDNQSRIAFLGDIETPTAYPGLICLDLPSLKMIGEADLSSSSYRFLTDGQGTTFAAPYHPHKENPTYRLGPQGVEAFQIPGSDEEKNWSLVGHAGELGWAFRSMQTTFEVIRINDADHHLPRAYSISHDREFAEGCFIYDDKAGVTVLDLQSGKSWQFKLPRTNPKDKVAVRPLPAYQGVALLTDTKIYLLQLTGEEPAIIPVELPS